jgi:excisionase family DNA binding protein
MSKPNSTVVAPLLAIPDVAALLKVSTKTIRRWIKDGKMHVHLIGRQIRIAEDDLQLFLVKHRH